jgi:hypothetical protein
MIQSPVIIGGSSLVASYLMVRLARQGATAQIVTRRPVRILPGCARVSFESLASGLWTVPQNAPVISLLPLFVLPTILDRLAGAGQIVALGSTSLFSKAVSADPAERASAEKLAAAEQTLQRWCAKHDLPLTILRPTLVYDFDADRNIARMAKVARRYKALLLAAPATGLRQPIHADDVAKAILAAVGNPEAKGKALNIAGAEVLSYRTMAERVFAGLGQAPRIIMLPQALLGSTFSVAQRVGVLRETAFGCSIFARMNQDLVFDIDEALQILRYDPRPFDLVAPPRAGDLDFRMLAKAYSSTQTVASRS